MILSVIISFILKLIIVLLIGLWFYKINKNVIESLVCGWLLMYELQIALMLFFSCFKIMNRWWLGFGLIVIIVMLFLVQRKRIFDALYYLTQRLKEGHQYDYIIWGGAILLFIYVAAHNFLFFDGTWDAHTYELPRIEFFSQKASLFVNMKSGALNIFCNEWNGELNGIFYRIMGNENQGIFFSNTENFFYGLFVVWWFAEKIGINRLGRGISLLFYCSFPVIVFMSMSSKGDFLAIVLFLCVTIWLKEFLYSETGYSLLFLAISLGLAAGTKITMVPFAGLCFISICIYFLMKFKVEVKRYVTLIKKTWKSIVLGVLLSVVGCFRYVLNYIYFGDFFQRVESVNISFKNIKSSFLEMLKTILFPDNAFIHADIIESLNQDLGIVGFPFIIMLLPVVILWCMMSILREPKRKMDYKILFILFPTVGSCFFLMASTNWYSWSFRYYTPWICTLFIVFVLLVQDIISALPMTCKKLILGAVR
ncbi:MAG: hypothetical protein GX235_07895 [Clostridiales bacterium]|nr:hypothetical protein [Clostridiales bacterium]